MIHSYNEGLFPEKLKLGTLLNVPYLSVNAFCKDQHFTPKGWNDSRAFFLTHFDKDIVRDVLNIIFLENLSKSPEYSAVVFMHELCYNQLIYWITTANDPKDRLVNEKIFRLLQRLRRKSKIVFLNANERIRLIFGNPSEQRNYFITDVTPISAGHNAGSVMLLIEPRPLGEGEGDENKERIFYTGNCRVSLKDLRDCRPLHHKCGAIKPITRLYIDTTFCMPHVQELPPRRMVEKQLLKFMKAELTLSADIRFEIWTTADINSVKFLRSIYLEYKEPIHVPRNLQIFLENLPGCKFWTTYDSVIGQDCHFHCSCKEVNNNLDCSVGNFNIVHDVCNIVTQCDMFRTPVYPTEDETHWKEDSQVVYVKKPDIFRGIYSSHLSRYEMGRMINFLRVHPDNVYPIYRPKFMTFDHVIELIERTCEETKNSKDEAEEFSSHAFDFTGENPVKCKDEKKSTRPKIKEYHFDTEIDLDLEYIGRKVKYDSPDKKLAELPKNSKCRQVVSAFDVINSYGSKLVDLEGGRKRHFSS